MASRKKIDVRAIVEAAADLADKEGLDHVTLAAVAKSLGIRIPSLYNHVDGLQGLRRALAIAGLRQLSEHLGKAAIGKTRDAAIEAMLQAYRSFALAHPGRYAAALRTPDADDADWHQAAGEGIGILLTVLESYGLNGDEALHVVRAFRSIAHGFVALEAAGAFGLPLNLDESYRRLTRLLLEGLRKSPGHIDRGGGACGGGKQPDTGARSD